MASRLLDREATARVVIRCWGDFAIADAETGADLRPRGRKARALLAYLALHPGKPVSRERLVGLLWGDRAEEQARGSLRQTLFELRAFSHGERPVLEVERESVMLIAGTVKTDFTSWRCLCDTNDHERLLAALPDADDLLFANLDGIDPAFDDWLRVERTRQRDALIDLIADASAGALAAGQTRAARALHIRLLELNPDERAAASAESDTQSPPQLAPLLKPSLPRRRSIPLVVAALLTAGSISGAIWVRPVAPTALTPNRTARSFYETAHEIIYQRRVAEYPIASQLLRRALVLDPTYVPAIADLAAVLAMLNPAPGDHPEAERLARKAVQLDPNSAMASGVLGMVLGFESDEARASIKRAAMLDWHDPQIQFWLSTVLAIEGDYAGQFQALRRAVATDPSWYRAEGTAALLAWQLGYREEADTYAAKLREMNLLESFECEYSIDSARGDYSGVVRDTLAVRERLNSPGAADWKLGMALLVLGHDRSARLLLRLPPPLWRVASGAGPAPGELEPLLIQADRDPRADGFALTALRQTLKAGRAAEIVAAYDRRIGRLRDLASPNPPVATLVTDGLQVALSLRQVGRDREATMLLNRADAAIRRSHSHGAVPTWLDAAAASIWAVQGRKEQALAALRTAIDRGWHYAPMTPRPDMGDIPSFAGLRGDPRFERLRQQLIDHIDHERRALGQVPV